MRSLEVLLLGWGEDMRPVLLRHRTARAVSLLCGPKMKTSRRLARVMVQTPPAKALFFQEPKTVAKQDQDSCKPSNDRWMAPSFSRGIVTLVWNRAFARQSVRVNRDPQATYDADKQVHGPTRYRSPAR